MTEPFDPYYKWLGIRPEDRPISYYRLLGLEFAEEDPEVIDAAADRQMSFLRTLQNGRHGADTQRLLNELASARLVLLDPEKRQQYNQYFRSQAQAAGHPEFTDDLLPPADPIEVPQEPASQSPRPTAPAQISPPQTPTTPTAPVVAPASTPPAPTPISADQAPAPTDPSIEAAETPPQKVTEPLIEADGASPNPSSVENAQRNPLRSSPIPQVNSPQVTTTREASQPPPWLMPVATSIGLVIIGVVLLAASYGPYRRAGQTADGPTSDAITGNPIDAQQRRSGSPSSVTKDPHAENEGSGPENAGQDSPGRENTGDPTTGRLKSDRQGTDANRAGIRLMWDAGFRQGGKLKINGQERPIPLEQNEWELEVSPGQYHLVATQPGYASAERQIQLTAGQTRHVPIALSPLARLVLEWPTKTRSGAQLSINDQQVPIPSRGPITLARPPGPQEIFITGIAGWNAFRKRVVLRAGQTVSLAVREGASQQKTPNGPNGLHTQYFTDGNLMSSLEITSSPQVRLLPEQLTKLDLPSEEFSVRWQGWLRPPARVGLYRLSVEAGGNADVWVDEQLVIRDRQPLSRPQGSVFLDDLPHKIRVEYRHTGGPPSCTLLWQPPAEASKLPSPFTPIPPKAFCRDLSCLTP